ncbi:glycosyltransferase [Crocosphaera sp.]|uniref:glycosyltransferase n=1 Tax=Crocosphaera sp. TaxID=2729996 RepID=UPI00260EF190|nr:glycosyltransferase [Crocosphaera sp.]MDJ0579529.1 glycosyltransferase [Crocosphaera sp.]
MKHIGLYCVNETGHLNTMLPLGKGLQKKGYQITFFGVPDAETKIKAANLDFYPIGADIFPLGSTEALFNKKLSKLKGIPALQFTINWFYQSAQIFLEEGANALEKTGVEALIVDQLNPEGGTVAQLLDIPFITVCSALPFNQEPGIPPVFTPWPYHDSWWANLRNWLTYKVTNPFGQAGKKLRLKYRQKWQLGAETYTDSPLAILCHQPAALDFPRQTLPPHFYYTGPYHTSESRLAVDFPWHKLTGQPLIYASMGTLQNCLSYVFEAIAGACQGLDAQLVISLGGGSEPDSLPNLPGNPLVVKYAPQLELVQKAALTITHAGMNTTLESLTYGVPMIAIPVTNDQPGIAARIAWTGVGEMIALDKLNSDNLRPMIQRVLGEKRYYENAKKLQQAIENSGGIDQAVTIIEQAIKPISGVQ